MPLSQAALDVLKGVPVLDHKGWVFTSDGGTPISGFSKFKRDLDRRVVALLDEGAELPRWTTHDLRRTARSLMSRAGVAPNHGERAMGHVIGGVQGTYDRHSYADEKRLAFEALAAQVSRILNPGTTSLPFVEPANALPARLG